MKCPKYLDNFNLYFIPRTFSPFYGTSVLTYISYNNKLLDCNIFCLDNNLYNLPIVLLMVKKMNKGNILQNILRNKSL